MEKKKSFTEEFWTGLRDRLWIVPWGVCLALLYAGIGATAAYGLDPIVALLALIGAAGSLLMPAIPTMRDLKVHFRQAVETVDARFVEKKITRWRAEEILTEASSYAHHRNVIWWPLWWLSARAKIRRLIAENL